MEKVAFGGGCHWCTEAIFSSLKGVSLVEQGWVNSTDADGRVFSEAVIVYFDAREIWLEVLVEIHLFGHNATSNHTFRKKYRSAVYAFTKEEVKSIEILKEKQRLFKKPLITQVYSFGAFKLNDEKYLNYYKNNPERPFCQVRIEPKLKILLEKFSEYILE